MPTGKQKKGISEKSYEIVSKNTEIPALKASHLIHSMQFLVFFLLINLLIRITGLFNLFYIHIGDILNYIINARR